MAELVRVTRPGGQIVVIDTDWGLTRSMAPSWPSPPPSSKSWTRNAANGLAGRQLCALFADAGLRDPIVLAETMTSTDPLRTASPPFTTMAAMAARARAVSGTEANTWLE